MFGYIDESGSPGVTQSKNDYLVISLVIFDSLEHTEKSSSSIDRLRNRLKLPDNYEFHYSRNSNRVREAFIRTMQNMNFRTITVAIRKNDLKRTASYQRIAEYLTREIDDRFASLSVVIDSNPILHKELKQRFKAVKSNLTIKMARSHSDNLIQLADYVVALSARRLKGSDKAVRQYLPLIKKQLYFGEFG